MVHYGHLKLGGRPELFEQTMHVGEECDSLIN